MAAPVKTKRKLNFEEVLKLINDDEDTSDSDGDSQMSYADSSDNWEPKSDDCESSSSDETTTTPAPLSITTPQAVSGMTTSQAASIAPQAVSATTTPQAASSTTTTAQAASSTTTTAQAASITPQAVSITPQAVSTTTTPQAASGATTHQAASATATPGTESPEKKRGRRRKRDPSTWGRNIKARKRLRGEEYEGHKGRTHAAVVEGNPCNCRRKCFDLICETSRANLRKTYYMLPDFSAQRFFMSSCIKVNKPKRQYSGPNSRRQVTYEYAVTVGSQSTPVCKQALASILGVKIAKINYVCDLIKANDTPHEDKRGKHDSRPNKLPDEKRQAVLEFIDSVPRYRSHYTRRHNPNRYYLSPSLTQQKLYDMYCEKCVLRAEEPVSFRMFSDIFVSERNYHFGQPSLDTCKVCDQFHMELLADPQNHEVTRNKELHLRKAEAAQDNLKHDFEISKLQKHVLTIAFDFQQTLPTPHINTSVTFYARQLWTYNLGIHDPNNAIMNMWSEDVAGRGSKEVISSLDTYFKNTTPTAKHLIAWSDSCGGQNKNKNMISFWYYLVHIKKIFETVEHKFPIPGHTFLPCDRDFGVIEKKKRKTPAVYTPQGWFDLVRCCKKEKPFKVVEMSQKDNFIDIEPMKSRLSFRTVAMDGSKVNIQKALRIRIMASRPGQMLIAYTHNIEEQWQQVNISSQRGIIGNIVPARLYSIRRKIATPKLNDLRKLCQFIPVQFRPFYDTLQATIPSPRKLRTGQKPQSSGSNDSDAESAESFSSEESSTDSD